MLRIAIWGNLHKQRWLHQSLISQESSFRGSLSFLLLGEHRDAQRAKTQINHTSSPSASCPNTSDRPSWSSTTGSHPWILTVASVATQQWPCLPHVTQNNDPTWNVAHTTFGQMSQMCDLFRAQRPVSLCGFPFSFFIYLANSPQFKSIIS